MRDLVLLGYAGELAQAVVELLPEPVVAKLLACDPDDRKTCGQVLVAREAIEGGEQLSSGQVTRRTEDDECRGARSRFEAQAILERIQRHQRIIPETSWGRGYRLGAAGVMAGRSFPCGKVCRDGVELRRAEPVAERRHVGIRIDQFGIDDPSAQCRRVVLRTFVRQIRTVFAAVAIDLVAA